MDSGTGKKGIKLLISVSLSVKRLKNMSQGLRISRLIARFFLESSFIGDHYSIKPSVMCLRWLEIKFPESAGSSNSLRFVPRSIVRR